MLRQSTIAYDESAICPRSFFNRQGGSVFNQRRQPMKPGTIHTASMCWWLSLRQELILEVFLEKSAFAI